MRFGSLFAGVGGIDLGLERAGMGCAWQVETDAYCRAVLARHWPGVPRYHDVRTIDWREVAAVDLVAAGFPCQPVSVAGKRLAQADERWLWPEVARCLRVLRPRLALLENVPGLLVRGMGDVLGDLAACGYDAEWDCIPAAAVGAPHLRYRVFVVARRAGVVADAGGLDQPQEQARDDVLDPRWPELAAGPGASRGDEPGTDPARAVADAGGARPSLGCEGATGQGLTGARPRAGATACDRGAERVFARRPQPRDWWAAEPDVGRVAHGVPARVDRLRALGNAVVPQVAEWIGRRILEAQVS